jgi:hypothetical protein
VIYIAWFSWVSFSLLYWILFAECLRVTLVGLVPSCGGMKILACEELKRVRIKCFCGVYQVACIMCGM